MFNDLLINVTSFFRDPRMFQVLKSKVFPRLFKEHRDDLPLRMWVCGCATGEEAYSLAITVTEFLEETKTRRQVQIFATDISDGGIEKARAGLFPENISQDVSPEHLRRFFIKANGDYQIQRSIRDLCIFARQNVLVDAPFSNMDLICCRNVLIYFGAMLQRKIVPIFHYALRPTGFLVLGSAETIGPSSDLFTLLNKKYKVYLKKPSFLRHNLEITRPPQARAQDQPGPPKAQPSREANPIDLQEHVDRILLRDFAPGAVVVTSQFDVVQFRGRTGDYLEHAPGSPSLNLLKMARENLVLELRTALHKAAKQEMTVRQTGVELRSEGRTREIAIEVVPFKLGSERFFLVAFKETELSTRDAHAGKEGARAKATREKSELNKISLELLATKQSMQSIIEEQESTNEELKSANEEIQSSNEELQSTNEELETAKEELLSTNEELTTLNEELQNRNTQLSEANVDLNNLLSSVNIAIIMVDEHLTIRRYTPLAERMFNLIASDIGRPFPELNRAVFVPDMEALMRRVIESLAPIEREVQDREGRSYALRIRPYRTRDNKIDGAVLLLVDTGELNRALGVIAATITQPLLVLGADLRVRSANDAFHKKFDLTVEQTQGRLIYEMGENQWNIPELRSLLEEVLPKNTHVNNFEVNAQFSRLGDVSPASTPGVSMRWGRGRNSF